MNNDSKISRLRFTTAGIRTTTIQALSLTTCDRIPSDSHSHQLLCPSLLRLKIHLCPCKRNSHRQAMRSMKPRMINCSRIYASIKIDVNSIKSNSLDSANSYEYIASSISIIDSNAMRNNHSRVSLRNKTRSSQRRCRYQIPCKQR